jgi:hypothetical protein
MAKVTINDPSFTPAPVADNAAPSMMQAPVIAAPSKTTAIETDSRGRKIAVRKLMPLHRLRLFAIAGELEKSESWMSLATLAFATTAIDGDPVTVNNRREIEICLERLGDEGVEAAAQAFVSLMPARDDIEDTVQTAGN